MENTSKYIKEGEPYTLDLFDSSFDGYADVLYNEEQAKKEKEKKLQEQKAQYIKNLQEKREKEFWKKHTDGWLDLKH